MSGKSGRTVEIKAQLFGKYYDTVIRKWSLLPLPNATVTFKAHRKINKNGTGLIDWGPVGRVVSTDAEGVAKTTYKLPSGAKKKLAGRYQATFPGGMFDGVKLGKKASRYGDVIVSR